MTHDCRERERERESQRLPAIDQLIQDGVIQAQRNGKGTFIGCSPTLLASDYKQVPLVLERVDECMNTEREREQRPQGLPEIEVIGMLESSGHDHSRRVHDPDGISPTATAVAGGTHHIKIFDHTKYRVRKLTPTEYGRLQAFRPENLSHRGIIENIVYGRTSAAAGFRKAGCGRCPASCRHSRGTFPAGRPRSSGCALRPAHRTRCGPHPSKWSAVALPWEEKY